ncbi:MAG: transglycosylase domain-containing protein [Dehalococcoidia bacterium]
MSVSARRRMARRGRQVERKGSPPPYWAFFGIGIVGIIGAAALAAVLVVSSAYNGYADDYRDPEEFIDELNAGGAKIFNSDGTLLYQYKDPDAGLRNPVPLTSLPEFFLTATISTEDNSFYDNPGVNIEGLLRAAWENSGLGNSPGFLEGSGGSSITQQLVKNLYFREELISGERSVERKLKETVLALELNKKKTKDEILELYINSISYGNDAYGVPLVGIQAAAEGYFRTDASALTLGEAALLAGIPKDPIRYNPVRNAAAARQRQRDVLNLMVTHGYITQAEADAAFNESHPLLENRTGTVTERIAEVQLRPELNHSFHFVRSFLPDVIERMCKAGQLNLPADIWDGNPDTLADTCDQKIVLRQGSEDRNNNSVLDAGEDVDGDGVIDPLEDVNGNGQLDEGEDLNGNGTLEIGADIDGDGVLDQGIDLNGDGFFDTEDANGNSELDPEEKDLNGDGVISQGGTYILGGLSITLSLDNPLQLEAERMVREHSLTFESTVGANNAALIAIEPSTGRILAYVGSRDFAAEFDSRGLKIDGQADILQSRQSPGSAFKLFTYVSAFASGSDQYPNWSPGLSVYNQELQISQPGSDCDGDFETAEEGDANTYCPRNAGGRPPGGQVTVRQALRSSINVPAVFTSFMLCPGSITPDCSIIQNAHRLGITDLVNGVQVFCPRDVAEGLKNYCDPDGDGEQVEGSVTIQLQDIGCAYDMTLGGCEVRPFDMAYAASVFANNGVMAGIPSSFDWSTVATPYTDGTPYETAPDLRRPLDPVAVLKVEDQEGNILFEFSTPTLQQVIPPQYPYLVSDILRLPTGTLGFEIDGQVGAVHGKTGTAEARGRNATGNTDTWVVGYSTQIAVAVWVGNTGNEEFGAEQDVFGSNTAGLIFREFMNLFHAGRPSQAIAEPEGLERGAVGGGCDPVVEDLFVAGSRPFAQEAEDDESCTSYTIDTRNQMLATDCVPEEFRETHTLRAFPEGLTVVGISDEEPPEETSPLCGEDGGFLPPFVLQDPTGDFDRDGIINIFDNCPLQPNRAQEDDDGDDIGNACDSGDGPGGDDDGGVIIGPGDDDDPTPEPIPFPTQPEND